MADEMRRHSFAEIAAALYPNLTAEAKAREAQRQTQQKGARSRSDRESLLRHLRKANERPAKEQGANR